MAEKKEETPTRVSLLMRAQEGSERAWSQIVGIYGPMIESRYRKVGFSHADTEDLVQDVFASLRKSLPQFLDVKAQESAESKEQQPDEEKTIDSTEATKTDCDVESETEAVESKENESTNEKEQQSVEAKDQDSADAKPKKPYQFRKFLRTIAKRRGFDLLRKKAKTPVARGGSTANQQIQQLQQDDLYEEAWNPDEWKMEAYERAVSRLLTDFTDRRRYIFIETVIEGRSIADLAEELDMKPGAVRQAKSYVKKRLAEELKDLVPLDDSDADDL